MRRRGRAQDSTEGPGGPGLGYGPSQGFVVLKPAPAFEAVWAQLQGVVGWGVEPDAVRSGRERLGE